MVCLAEKTGLRSPGSTCLTDDFALSHWRAWTGLATRQVYDTGLKRAVWHVLEVAGAVRNNSTRSN